MNVETRNMYSEVYSILNTLGDEYIEKLPKSLYEVIKKAKSEDYQPVYDLYADLNEQGIQRESLAMIALFHLNYWCNSEEEKAELQKIFSDNENKYQAELKEKYNPDNIFKNQDNAKKDNVINDNLPKENAENIVAMTEYKESIFKKFINKIKSIFHIRK